MTQTHTANDLNQQLQELAIQARLNPAKSLKRRQKLNEIVRLVTKSNKLWQENTPYYKDALQQTWLYFCRNIEQYDPSRCSVITWLNNCLKWRLQDYCKAEAKNQAAIVFPSTSALGEVIDPVDNLSASPEMPPILEETYQWVQTDPTQELSNIHVKGHPEVTCQILILRRLPPEVSWKDIAQEFNLPLSTAPNFYKRECLPRLRDFAHRQGYLT
jgi:DNA polymerase III psi subunit